MKKLTDLELFAVSGGDAFQGYSFSPEIFELSLGNEEAAYEDRLGLDEFDDNFDLDACMAEDHGASVGWRVPTWDMKKLWQYQLHISQ